MAEGPIAGETIGSSGDRAALHAELRVLLTGYGDDELTQTDRARVDAHLVSCERCQRDLGTQLSLRARFASLKPAAMPRQEERLREMLRATEPRSVEPRGETVESFTSIAPLLPVGVAAPSRASRIARGFIAGGGWLVAATLAGILLSRPTRHPSDNQSVTVRAVSGIRDLFIDSAPVPMVEAALADYARRTGGELPLGVGNADSIFATLPFRVAKLNAPDARVVAVWMTEIRGEPAAAVAYRWRDEIVVQYTVPERLFFRQARVRDAVARGALYAVRRGPVSAVAWPNKGSGSILIGNASPLELATLRA